MMKKCLLIATCSLLLFSTNASAQKRRPKTTKPAIERPTVNIPELIDEYRFEEAINALNQEILYLTDKSLSTEEAEQQLHYAEKAQSRMNATEQVIFVDSIVVPYDDIFQNIYLSDEVGTISSFRSFFKTEANPQTSVFLSQMKDKVLYADLDSEGNTELFSRDLVGNDWNEPSPLSGLEELESQDKNYPYMLADGVTLYFAAKGEESLGGYDIFQTRYDADSHQYLAPDNIGMPFNSAANDYLYVVDDFNNIGYFVSDRFQQPGYVCIYTFIPNQTRRIYNQSLVSPEQLRSYALIRSIGDTWETNQSDLQDARSRLEKLKEVSLAHQTSNSEYKFVLNDNRIILQASDLRNAEAQKQFAWWMESKKQLEDLNRNIESLRIQYSKSKDADKQALRPQIIEKEQMIRQLNQTVKKMANDIRTLEAQ